MSQNVNLKLHMPHGIKKIKDPPINSRNLMKLIEINLQDNKGSFKVEYEDADGDAIIITDDSDLQLAYEFAKQSKSSTLKLYVI